ncbi:acetyl-CoA C-acetyltransferase [Antricoccus suffuscus]|uniref:Acetyl-CoA C-acetyltransferase n=1 Tax=Antricoccus suffuscus TaxID=1629062 RepID=A0A2T1A508_9ACTN|nr:thiolase family protein [Antricoccus suffuscus]PRZ43691.1 acetyl-CoA C-acetyltransferase [Antricoccus suffuscus]
MTTAHSPVIVSARRTPVGTAGHGLRSLTVDALAAAVLTPVAEDVAGLGLDVDDVILGNCLGPGGNIARVAALRAKMGESVPGVTVDRQCGSGLDAILQGASRVAAGDAELVLAGGAESASTAPWRMWPPAGDTPAHRYTRAPFAPNGFPDPEMGPAADALAARLGISRERQDAWAARSHRRALAAQTAGLFAAELVSVGGLDHDERPRAGLDERRLSRLRAAFAPTSDGLTGTATAGNSCGISDGAAVTAITTERHRVSAGLPGLRVIASAVAGSDPALPGIGAIPAIRKALQRSDVGVPDIGAVEITEAFASQIIAAVDDLGFDENIVCADGGAIAYGHPWGASGAILVTRLFTRMLAPAGPAVGLAACAIGGGQGIALIVERVR